MPVSSLRKRGYDSVTLGLFDQLSVFGRSREALGEGAWVLRGLALDGEAALLAAVASVLEEQPPERLVTPGGRRMSVAMSNAGPLGWVSDETGYRYSAINPKNARPWPAMPGVFSQLARDAAAAAGFDGFVPNACLVNVYEPGARLSLHQDKDELDYAQPIVSVSLGLPATFLFGGLRRAERPVRVGLAHGDVVVWGGPSRLRFHGVAPLADGEHRALGRRRVNLTFRRAR